MEKGKYDFEGSESLKEVEETASYLSSRYKQTFFSVGIFQWIPTKDGKGLKRSPVRVRVRGQCLYPEKVYALARQIVNELDMGAYTGKKNVTA